MFRLSGAFLLIILYWTAPCFAQETYTLEADQVSRLDNSTYNAKGDVILKVKDIVFNADDITYNIDTEEVHAKGNVKIKSPTQEIEAGEINYNVKTESGKASDIKGFLAPFNYICAKSMERTGATTFTVQDARISTCSGDVPDWSVSMYYGEMEIGGYMNASHATADILNTPLLYAPKLIYPVSTERQTGFLFPKVGFETDKGAFVGLQFYWAPDIDFDATVGLNWFSKRGLQEMAEVRYAESSDNSFYGAFSRIDDAASESDENVRWRAVLNNKYYPIKDLEITLDADHASDYLYMRDYGDFGISDFNRNNKDNMFFEGARIKYYSKFADMSVYYRNDYEFRDNTGEAGYAETRVERAPSVSISKVVTDIPFVIADYNLSFDRVGYNRYSYSPQNSQYTDKWQYNRFDAAATLYVPIDFKAFVFTPYASIRYTRWENSSKDFNSSGYSSPDFGHVRFINSKSAERYSGAAGATLALREIYKDFGFFRHGIQNVLEMKYSPKLDQNGLPDYIENDRVPYYGSISYEIINFLKGKNWLVKLTLDQGYDMLRQEHVMPLEAELLTSYSSYFSNTFKTTYKHSGELAENERRFQYFSDTLNIKPFKGITLTGEYTFDTRISSGSYNTSAKVGASVSFWRFLLEGYNKWQGYNPDLSFKNLVPFEQGASLTYFAECWSLGFEVETQSYDVNMRDGKYKRKEITFYVNFGLRGIGGSRIQFKKSNDESLVN